MFFFSGLRRQEGYLQVPRREGLGRGQTQLRLGHQQGHEGVDQGQIHRRTVVTKNFINRYNMLRLG